MIWISSNICCTKTPPTFSDLAAYWLQEKLHGCWVYISSRPRGTSLNLWTPRFFSVTYETFLLYKTKIDIMLVLIQANYSRTVWRRLILNAMMPRNANTIPKSTCQLRVIMLCICDWSISKWLLLLKRRKKQSSSRSLSKICWNNTKATKWIECLVRKSLKLYPKRPAKSYNRRCSTSLVYYQYSWFHDLCTIPAKFQSKKFHH